MAYVYKATILLSVQIYVYITKHKKTYIIEGMMEKSALVFKRIACHC